MESESAGGLRLREKRASANTDTKSDVRMREENETEWFITVGSFTFYNIHESKVIKKV